MLRDKMMSDAALPKRNFYGRRSGKSLRSSQREYLADLDHLAVPGFSDADRHCQKPLDPDALFGPDRPIWLEIGFGSGEHLVHQAGANPDVRFIGCEPYINGVATLLGKIRSAKLTNLAVHAGDVRDVFDVLPAASVSRAFLLYPDPWPKKRHHRRRFVNPEFLDPLAAVMTPGAHLRVATDIDDYVRQTLVQMTAHRGFDRHDPDSDQSVPWPDWISTRYEKKALREGRVPTYLTFCRNDTAV